MGATIRLMRYGKRNQPSYRIVVLDKRKKRDGEYLEKIGLYDPAKQKDAVIIDTKRVEYWLSRGAQLSEGLSKLIKHKKKPGKKKYKKSTKKAVKKVPANKKAAKETKATKTKKNFTPVTKQPAQEA